MIVIQVDSGICEIESFSWHSTIHSTTVDIETRDWDLWERFNLASGVIS